jgi:hypothetical protein
MEIKIRALTISFCRGLLRRYIGHYAKNYWSLCIDRDGLMGKLDGMNFPVLLRSQVVE